MKWWSVMLAVLVVPSSAQAGWKIDRATAIARVVWHHPCVDRMQLRWEDPVDPWLRKANAWADAPQCVVYFNARVATDWPSFCTRLLHEAGHLANFRDPLNVADPDHSLNPESVMYAEELQPNGDPRCDRHGRDYLRVHRAAGIFAIVGTTEYVTRR